MSISLVKQWNNVFASDNREVTTSFTSPAVGHQGEDAMYEEYRDPLVIVEN